MLAQWTERDAVDQLRIPAKCAGFTRKRLIPHSDQAIARCGGELALFAESQAKHAVGQSIACEAHLSSVGLPEPDFTAARTLAAARGQDLRGRMKRQGMNLAFMS